MLALAYSNDTLDIYGNSVFYMFYRFFEYGIGMVWVRIVLPDDFDEGRISAMFRELKVDEQRSFDYWSAMSRFSGFGISRYFRMINSYLNLWRSRPVKEDLMPRYQMRGSLKPVIVYNEPLLFVRSADPVLSRFHRNWLLAHLFASVLKGVLT